MGFLSLGFGIIDFDCVKLKLWALFKGYQKVAEKK